VSSTSTEGLRLRLEKLALALAVHGGWQVNRREARALASSAMALELRWLLREYFSEAETNELMGRHPSGCPCWVCVRGLNNWVRKTAVSRRSRNRRRPLVGPT
jgi:hypothetical protein